MKLIKIITILAFFTSAGSMVGSFELYQRASTAKQGLQESESRVTQLEEQNTFLESQGKQAERVQTELARLREQIKEQVKQRDEVKSELDKAYAQTTAFQKQIKDLQAEKNKLVQQLDLGQATDSAIVREAARLPVPPEESLPPVPAAAAPIAPVAAPPEAIAPEEAPLPPDETPVPAAESAAVPEGEEGTDQRPMQILSVNREFQFVVINVGLRGGVKIGDNLRVEQGGKMIGKIQVEKLYENFSACAILEETKPGTIHEGDLVRLA